MAQTPPPDSRNQRALLLRQIMPKREAYLHNPFVQQVTDDRRGQRGDPAIDLHICGELGTRLTDARFISVVCGMRQA